MSGRGGGRTKSGRKEKDKERNKFESSPVKYKEICCLLDTGIRCKNKVSDSVLNSWILETAAKLKLNITQDINANHKYICEYHMTVICFQKTKDRRIEKLQTMLKTTNNGGTKNRTRGHLTPERFGSSSKSGGKASPSPNKKELGPSTPRDSNSLESETNNGNNSGSRSATKERNSTKAGSNNGAIGRELFGENNHQGDPDPVVDLSVLSVETLRKYNDYYAITSKTSGSKEHLVKKLSKHFPSIQVSETDVIRDFTNNIQLFNENTENSNGETN